MLFADISAAFYAAVRQSAAPVEAELLERICAGLQLHQGDLLELQEKIREPSALEAEQASPW